MNATNLIRRFLLLLPCLFCAVAAGAADEKPEQPPTFTHRVTGLFSKDREADLRAVLEAVPGVTLVSVDFEHAEARFAYDPATAFKGTKPEKIAEAFDQKVRAASNSTFGIQPLCPTPKEQLVNVEIPVLGLDCKACCLAAYEAVAKVDGVAQATASFREGRVTALIDPARTNREALEAALKQKRVTLKQP